ncbi:hypothetical protein TEA_017409 [Camellia sinensis var. sinensis]|uniref:Uncharacterized protein n=1 Tax=Camellia sinensis var. sinensis TaxID=542762 RepID=A0A4S4E999_CAMSN|nr:hypothetical protein TEA_017409 [Camellia sinensis var. sinensis]
MAGTSMAWDHRRWRGGGQGKLGEGEVGSDRPLNTNVKPQEYWSLSKLLDRWLVLLNSARSDISPSAVCGLMAGGEQRFMAVTNQMVCVAADDYLHSITISVAYALSAASVTITFHHICLSQDGLTALDLCLYSGHDTRTYELIKLLKQLPKPRALCAGLRETRNSAVDISGVLKTVAPIGSKISSIVLISPLSGGMSSHLILFPLFVQDVFSTTLGFYDFVVMGCMGSALCAGLRETWNSAVDISGVLKGVSWFAINGWVLWGHVVAFGVAIYSYMAISWALGVCDFVLAFIAFMRI